MDTAACRGELQRVAENVVHDLLEPLLIGQNWSRPCHVHQQLDLLGLGRRTRRIDREGDQLAQVQRLHVQSQLSGDHAGQVHEVFDELRLQRDVSLQDLQTASGGLLVRGLLLQNGDPPHHHVERGAQLVRNGPQELILGLVGCAFGFFGCLRVREPSGNGLCRGTLEIRFQQLRTRIEKRSLFGQKTAALVRLSHGAAQLDEASSFIADLEVGANLRIAGGVPSGRHVEVPEADPGVETSGYRQAPASSSVNACSVRRGWPRMLSSRAAWCRKLSSLTRS
ncbi:MAG TPA: hypothetical protein VEL28_04215 [Candidatus Binatia bacterium]|nr:hypothetical protein [Candidatus Binatia bacterium]